MKLTTAALRKAMFGRGDRSSCYIIQAWYVDSQTGEPGIWRSRFAYTEAGVQRIVRGKELTEGIRGEHRIQILRVQEVDS